MQRKELKKSIKEFSHRTNFYELGLVRKLLKHREKTEKDLINNTPKVTCPSCGSTKISIEYDDREYSCDSWLCCESCGEEFDDEFGLQDTIQSVQYICWGYTVDVTLYFEEPDIKTLEWKNRCRKLILQELNTK